MGIPAANHFCRSLRVEWQQMPGCMGQSGIALKINFLSYLILPWLSHSLFGKRQAEEMKTALLFVSQTKAISFHVLHPVPSQSVLHIPQRKSLAGPQIPCPCRTRYDSNAAGHAAQTSASWQTKWRYEQSSRGCTRLCKPPSTGCLALCIWKHVPEFMISLLS